MSKACIISSYCIIRDNQIILDDKVLYKGPPAVFAKFSADVYRHFTINYPKFHKMDNLSKLGFLSADILLKDKELMSIYKAEKVGIILMNSASSLDTDRNYQKTITSRSNYFPSPAVFVYTLPNVVIGEIAIRHKIFGEGNFFVMEKFDSAFLVNYISYLFDNEIIDSCISGWVEYNGSDFESVVFLISKSIKTETGIATFEPANIMAIYNRK